MGKWGKCNICDLEIVKADLNARGVPYLNPDNDNPVCFGCFAGSQYMQMHDQIARDEEVAWRRRIMEMKDGKEEGEYGRAAEDTL